MIMKKLKLIQIISHENYLYGLDKKGQIWKLRDEYDENLKKVIWQWILITDEVSPPFRCYL